MQRHLVGVLVVLAVACDTPATQLAAPPTADAPALSQGIVASATGSGHFTQGGELRTLALSATGQPDGSAQGNYQINIHAIDAYIHVAVTCMRARNDTAWIGGIITRTNHPVVVEGTVSYFWVVDKGEGPGAVDVVSAARVNDRAGEDQVFCGLTPPPEVSGLPANNIEVGNIQVRNE